MKKIILVLLLSLLVFPVFAQDAADDEYAKFQGVWYATIDGYTFPRAIFIGRSFLSVSDNFTSGDFSVKDGEITLVPKITFDESGIRPSNEDITIFKYAFVNGFLTISINGVTQLYTKLL
ncbi:MAG: hypothetical protein LBQ88_17305 [Treponema sp.]|jgi:hypothetical protein|nr:hypothetical protein [Treponema sp.]